MIDTTREIDTIARVGGDEFTVLLPGITDGAHLTEVGNRIIAQLERPIDFDGAACRISASIGSIRVGKGQDAVAEDCLVRTLMRRSTAPSTLAVRSIRCTSKRKATMRRNPSGRG